MDLIEMPLFPLKTVLFPGGTLPLRIFEPRYLTMIGEQMRADKGFAVVLLRDGEETDAGGAFYATGTEAKVVDFDQLDNGMLGITCVGRSMIRVQSHVSRDDQLLVGQVERLEFDDPVLIPAEFDPLAQFLRRVLDQEEVADYRRWLTVDWQNADWVGARLAELLPLTLTSKQTLLETDALQRLEVLQSVIDENQPSE